MIVFYLIFAMIFANTDQPASSINESFSIKLSHLDVSTSISNPDRVVEIDQMRSRHQLRMSWEFSLLDTESLYCYISRYHSIKSEDEKGNPFVRSKVRDPYPPMHFQWMGKDSRGNRTERVKQKGGLGTTNTCDRIPPTINRLEINLPMWKAKRIEHVTVPITADKVWQPLPNGAKVMAVIEPEYSRVMIYREHSLSDTGDPVPPPFHISSILQEDGTDLRGTSRASLEGLVPDNPEQAGTKKIVYIKQRYAPEREMPGYVVLAVVHEYEQVNVQFILEDAVLGDFVPFDKILP